MKTKMTNMNGKTRKLRLRERDYLQHETTWKNMKINKTTNLNKAKTIIKTTKQRREKEDRHYEGSKI